MSQFALFFFLKISLYLKKIKKIKLLKHLLFLPFLIGSLLFIFAPQQTFAATASDNFNRANGPLGSNWTNVSDGGLTIANDIAKGTKSSANSGDMWKANTFG